MELLDACDDWIMGEITDNNQFIIKQFTQGAVETLIGGNNVTWTQAD